MQNYQAVTINHPTITMDQVLKFAPTVYLCNAEPYIPCSIEYILRNSMLCDEDDSGFQIKSPSQKDLLQYYQEHYYLLIDPKCYDQNCSCYENPGLDDAIMYVAVQIPYNKQYVDLKYIFLFAFNGAQTATILPPVADDFDCALASYAEHQGDIEGITVRVTPDFQQILNVVYEAHGNPTSFNACDIDYEHETHPKVFCAYNSHATYNSQGVTGLKDVILEDYSHLDLGVKFVDVISSIGSIWRPFDYDQSGQAVSNGHLVFVGLDEHDQPINDQYWAKFKGKIGTTKKNSFSQPNSVAGIELTD
ncbi:MAG: DUF946 domain-containing protein, partial [Alphaproteobacteria bacterium]